VLFEDVGVVNQHLLVNLRFELKKNAVFERNTFFIFSPLSRQKEWSHLMGLERGGVMGPTGDEAESKRASSGSPDLLISISPIAFRAWLSAIATQKAHFALLAIFGV